MQTSEHLTQRDSPELHNSYFMCDAVLQLSQRGPQTRVTKAKEGTTHSQLQQQSKSPRFNMTLSYVALFIEKHKRFF